MKVHSELLEWAYGILGIYAGAFVLTIALAAWGIVPRDMIGPNLLTTALGVAGASVMAVLAIGGIIGWVIGGQIDAETHGYRYHESDFDD